MVSFDPDTFMSQTTEEASSTQRVPVPIGEYPMIVDDGDKAVTVNEFGENHAMNVVFVLQDADVQAQLGLDKVTSRMTVWLDLTDDGQLDMSPGKNVGLGRLRDALGQNQPGQPWSPAMLKGAGPVLGYVEHRPNKDDPEIVYDNVKKVAPLQ